MLSVQGDACSAGGEWVDFALAAGAYSLGLMSVIEQGIAIQTLPAPVGSSLVEGITWTDGLGDFLWLFGDKVL